MYIEKNNITQIDQKNSEIELNHGNRNILKNNQFKTKLIIILIILLIIIAFILILIFVIIKKEDKKYKIYTDDSKIPVIFDVDEGGDDMIAYTIANNSRKYNILGITTVSPEYVVDNVTDIWLKFLEYMNFDVKVYKGENHPLIRETQPIEFFHDYQINFPSTNKKCESKNAIDFMIDTIKSHRKKITLFLLAPLTNFAKAYQKDKSIINNINEIIIMGGAKKDGNMGPYNDQAEYNIYMDAEAANIVFNCGIKPKVMGTDITHKVEFTDETFEKYLNMNTTSSLFVYYAMKGNFITYGENYLHDPATILYHLNNNIIKLKDYYAKVNTTNPDVNDTDYGSISFFEPNNDDKTKTNIKYSESIDLDLYWKTFDKYIQKY